MESFKHSNEKNRLKNLSEYNILDSELEVDFDNIALLASQICGTKISMINFIDEKRLWSKSAIGITRKDLSRKHSFCSYTIENPKEPLIIPDTTQDERFLNNPYVKSNPKIKFYAGLAIMSEEGFALGSICVMDSESIQLSKVQIDSLRILASQIQKLLTLRRSHSRLLSTSIELKLKSSQLEKFFEANIDLFSICTKDLQVITLNKSWENTLGFTLDEFKEKGLKYFIHPEDLHRSLKEAKTLSENNPILNFTNRYLCRNGTYKTLEWRSFEENNLIYSSARDVSEKLRFENEIETQKKYTESILAALPDLLFIVNQQGIYLNFKSNNESDLLLKPEDFLGKSIQAVLPKALASLFIQNVKETIESQSPKAFRYDLPIKGMNKNFEARFTPFEKDKTIIIVRNITAEKQIQDQLERTKELLEIAGRISKTGAWEVDFITNNIVWSKTTRQIMEVDEDYIPSIEKGLSFYKGKSKEIITVAVQNAIEKGIPYDLELEITSALGNSKWVRTQGQPVIENGKCIYFYGTFQDITEKFITERAIRESENDYRRLFENMAQGVVYQRCDGTIIRVNKAAEDILGLTYDQMIGRTSVDPRWHAIREDGSPFPGEEHPSMRALKTGKTVKNEIMGVFHPKTNKHRWISIDAIPEFQENSDEPYRVLSTFKDITKNLNIQQEILENRANLQAIIESSPDSIWSLDLNLKVIFCNQKVVKQYREAFGKSLEIGMEMLELIPSPLKEIWIKRYQKAFNGETVKFSDRLKIGHHIFHFESSINPVYVEEKIIGVAIFSKDITESRKHVSTIEAQNKILKEIAWMQSHKVRAPLARLMGLVMLLEDDQNDITPSEILNEIMRSAHELDTIIREISSKTHQLEE